MILTADILRAAYAYLAETAPFTEWNMPDAEDVEFVVHTRKPHHGRCVYRKFDDKPRFVIEVKGGVHQHSVSLLATMAHEMVHVHEYQNGIKGKAHGAAFKALAAEVCAEHGFDPGQF